MDNLNKWLTLLANIGVLAGIIFVALEIQQNTSAIQATAIQESTEVARANIMAMVNDPSLIELRSKDIGELTDLERQRASWLARSFWLSMQGLYRQWSLGVLPEEEWGVWFDIICANAIRDNGISGREFWLRQKSQLIPSFERYVDSSC